MIWIITCPWYRSGVPESLHQLDHTLRTLGERSFLLYDEPRWVTETMPEYAEYEPQSLDRCERGLGEDVTVIMPECYDPSRSIYYENLLRTRMKFTGKIRFGMHWLSRDNPQWDKLGANFDRIAFHLCQSNTVRNWLSKHHPDFVLFDVKDYINRAFLSHRSEGVERENIILFNPLKGMQFTSRLFSSIASDQSFPQFEVRRIENMSPRQINELMRRAKIYVDFGHHPGRDRIPREAVACGCTLIVGKRGTAVDDVDVPIHDRRKIDVECADWIGLASNVIRDDLMRDCRTPLTEFKEYRQTILSEQDQLKEQVQTLIRAIRTPQ